MNPYLLPTIEFGPIVVQRLVREIPADRWGEVTEPGRFNVREAVAHLADWEPFWLERFRVGLDTPGGTIVPYDEGQMAIDGKYDERDPNEEAARFAEGRKKVANLLRSLTPEQWTHKIDHPERGMLDLLDLANMILGHDMYHVEHLTQYLSKVPVGTSTT